MPGDSSERRKYERYDTDAKIYFRVTYDVTTRVEYQIVDVKDHRGLSAKYSAIGKDVSVEGIGFTAERKLDKGDILYLEVYVPSSHLPIRMEGEVRWSQPRSTNKEGHAMFDTGVKLITVNGHSVMGSIYFDEQNQVVWSIVLDAVFGNFKKLQQHNEESTPTT